SSPSPTPTSGAPARRSSRTRWDVSARARGRTCSSSTRVAWSPRRSPPAASAGSPASSCSRPPGPSSATCPSRPSPTPRRPSSRPARATCSPSPTWTAVPCPPARVLAPRRPRRHWRPWRPAPSTRDLAEVTEMDKLFCVGDEKTGTHSVAGLFSAYRAEHEPEAHDLRPLVEARLRGDLADGELERYLDAKDARLPLDVDSSFLNGEIIDVLVPRYPGARYVLTLREPRSWLDSKINQMITYASPRWLEPRALRDGAAVGHPHEEAALAARGLPTLDGFFSEYARFNTGVVAHVPPERLLVLRTPDIRAHADRLAA